MGVNIESSYKSLNKLHEELCGDMVEYLKMPDFDVVILSDGMGSGVKANILATLTARILKKMFSMNAPIEMAVETIIRTLPICQVRKTAYSTFSILQIFHDGRAYIAEYDSPDCIFIRDGRIEELPFKYREIEGKMIRECRIEVKPKDVFVQMSDGVINAGTGEILNYSWTRDDMAAYTLKCTNKTLSAPRLAGLLSDVCNDLYDHRPGDDTTVAVTRVIDRKVVNVFTGPPENKEDDERVMSEFMRTEGKHIVCGGTTAAIASRYLKQPVVGLYDGTKEVPPTSTIKGLDLVTEGVLTMSKALSMLKELTKEDIDFDIFLQMDEDNGAAKLSKFLSEECTELNLFVGRANNEANQLLYEITVRNNLIKQLEEVEEKLGKTVTVKYY